MDTYDNFKYIGTNLEMSFFFKINFRLKYKKKIFYYFIKHMHKIHISRKMLMNILRMQKQK